MVRNIFFVSVIAIALLLFNNQTFCQGMKGKFGLSLNGGLSKPIRDFSREIKEGGGARANGGGATASYGLSGGLEYFVTENFIVGGILAYRPFDIKTDNAARELEDWLRTEYEEKGISISDININNDGSNKITSFGLYVKYLNLISHNALSYLKFGVGMGNCKSSFDMPGYIIIPDAERSNFNWTVNMDIGRKFYFEGGGGYLFKLSDTFAIGSEILYSRLMTKNTWIDIDITMETADSTQREKDRGEVKYNCDYISAFINFSIFLGGSNSRQ